MHELTGLEYRSKEKGVDPEGKEVSVMHACEFEFLFAESDHISSEERLYSKIC